MQPICNQLGTEMQILGNRGATGLQPINKIFALWEEYMDSQEKIILEIQAVDKRHGSVLEQYRQALIEMTKKYFTQKEMAEMLNKGGVKITRQGISKYLRKKPITMEELNGKNESGSVNLNQWKKQKTSKKKKEKKVFFNLDKPF